MKSYNLTEQQLIELLNYAHSYGRSEQFNYGLFGPLSKQAEHFTDKKAVEYCLLIADNTTNPKNNDNVDIIDKW